MQLHHHFQLAQHLTKTLDTQFRIFGFKFGLDPLLGLIPGVGDLFSLALSAYIVWIAVQLRVPFTVLGEMVINILFDFFLGILPVIGDLSDFVYRANTKNMELLKKYYAAPIIDGRVI